jgi:predicted DNA-binding WGR domain protein
MSEIDPGKPNTLAAFLESGRRALPAEDVLHVMLPLMRQVAGLHGSGRVANLGLHDIIENADGAFALSRKEGEALKSNIGAIQRVQPQVSSALKVIGEYRVTNDDALGAKVEDLQAAGESDENINKPVYLAGLRNWEIELGHHDEVTDVFQLGMILACVSCGIDPGDETDVERFSSNRSNLFALQPRLHPVIASIIIEMTALNRHERATDVAALARRLETYRDQPAGIQIESALARASGVPGRRTAVLAHLRDRLFDLSRRNRLIYFKPTQSSVNLTEASVPIVMRLESVRADQLCTWGGQFVSEILSGKSIQLSKWLRFEDQHHLPSAFDRIIQETRRDRAEYGFSNLRLVVAFLRWHNLKEAPNERIVSPLLWLPVEVTKTKGVRDQYVLRCPEPVAEFNPALRHMLRQLYDIQLPDAVDLTSTDLTSLHANLMEQIHKTEPGVRLELQQRPQIQLILQKAVQRVRQLARRRGQKERTVARAEFSYDRDDYRPLGFALFEKFVKPSPLPQRLAAGGHLKARPQYVVAETEAQTFVMGGDDGHRFSWEVDLTQVTLANFNYKKMSLVRDYSELIDRQDPQPGFDQVFSIEPRPFAQEVAPELSLSERWGVVAADTTQNTAVAMARTGRSFIIQGPPGTGKSQTITNLIADYAARGKRVLFVCEKRAALDVVYHRLGQAGLDGLSCIIHDSQEDKKEFIHDLKGHYQRWGKNADRLAALTAERNRTVSALEHHLGLVTAFDAAASNGAPSLRALVRRAAALPQFDGDVGNATREQLPEVAAWDANRSMADAAQRAARESLGLQSLAEHPFARLNARTVHDDRPFSIVEQAIDAAEAALGRMDSWLEGGSVFASSTFSLGSAVEGCALAERLQTTGLAQTISLLDPTSAESQGLRADEEKLEELREKAVQAQQDAGAWNERLSAVDTSAALDLAQAKEGSFFAFLSGDWRRLKQTIKHRYDFSAHAVRPKLTHLLEMLAASHDAEAELEAERQAIAKKLGTRELEALLSLRTELLDVTQRTDTQDKLILGLGRNGQAAAANEASQLPFVRQLREAVDLIIDGSTALSFDQIAEVLRDMRENLDELPDILPILKDIHTGDAAVSFALRSVALPPQSLEALIVDEEICRLERRNPEIKRFDAARMIELTRRAATARDVLRRDNASAICGTLHRSFKDHVKASEMSVTLLDGEGKRFKKRYATGRRELEHEFGKTMRYRSIRDLASSEPGMVVNDLKPIWLMSPLSVSDTLPLEPDLFDVVIFDEASQIPTEEAVPALCRSGQVIIVGDEMQLPPTSFFSTSLDEDDMQIEAEEDGEKIAIVLDADSLLNQAARNLPATLLAWHYRSRFEALISFSNAAFYNGQLVTIPDRSLRIAETSPTEAVSDNQTAWSDGVVRLLRAPITWHRLTDGVYDKRVNLPEARYIAGLVRELLIREDGQSIGIVAFSEAQQSEIETALERLAAQDANFAAALEREYTREDDGQFNGLFVKNLENVQGDERDIILMSVCYAPDPNGRMVMNFGPINQRGGEKRLNVIFSRARKHMAIVTTIAPEAITNVHNDGARALRAFLSFAEAQSKGAVDHAQAVLSGLNPEAAQTFGTDLPYDPVRLAIAETLRARGHVVHEYVGGASFRCDLAIVHSEGKGYALAVLLDRAGNEAASVEERFLFRPTILRSFGWRVLDVPCHTWFRDRKGVIDRIERELGRDSWSDADSDHLVGVSMPVPEKPDAPQLSPSALTPLEPREVGQAIVVEEPASDETAEALEKLTEFRFTQGTSNKFWRVGVVGCDLIVEFGRIGTKGQRVVKTYDDTDRAKREEVKLTLEKTRKGYEEFG